MRFKLSLPATGGRNSFDIGDRVGLSWDSADAQLVAMTADAPARR
jgi:hypothetical protein